MNNLISLFPLNLVVFPYSKIPLHIFEEKYKKMVSKCIGNKCGFGIVSIFKEKISEIGSYVNITDIINRYANGELDIIVKGVLRFRIIETQLHRDKYLTAKVKEYPDISDEIDKVLQEELKNNFLSILKKINFKLDEAFWNNYNLTELKSYKIAEKSGLSLEQQQEFLSLQQENDRIYFLLKHLEKIDKQVKENAITGAIIMGNGYIN